VTADKLPIEDILTVKHDVVPLDGADVFQQGEIESIGSRIALTEDREISDPVGDLGQDQAVQVFICSHSSRALIRLPPVKGVPG